jgi:predicted ATPase
MLVPFTLGDAEETRTRADHVVWLSEEHGFAGQAAFGSFFRGWAIAMNGDYESGVAAMDEAERRLCAVGNDVYLSARLLGVADAHRRHGRTGLALIALDAADAFLVRSGERLQEPELHRLRGLLALDAGDEDLAGRAFERALASARTLGAPFFELRAATALARCRGGDAKARHTLERIYAGFTEGLDHLDLIQARETLDGSATEA